MQDEVVGVFGRIGPEMCADLNGKVKSFSETTRTFHEVEDATALTGADKAWDFVQRCIFYLDADPREGITTTPSSHYSKWPAAPPIPELVMHTRRAIGGSIRGGLLRIASTKPEHMGMLRADFDRAYARLAHRSAL